MNAELERFVRDALAHGVPRETIRAELARGRWPADEIDAALGAWLESDLPVPVPRRRVALSAREAFLYLLVFATLYLVAYHVGVVLFGTIEMRLPDAAAPAASAVLGAWRDLMRWGAATILIAFPVYLYASRVVARGVAREPEKRSSNVRRSLTYLTLFIGALVLIGDLVFVVARALSGELAPRFVLKAAVVFAIAGVVFGHYLGGLRRDEDDRPARPGADWLARAGAAGVVLALGLALFAAGSPVRARVREIDRRRLTDLSNLAQQVRLFRAREGRVPITLRETTGVPYATPGLSLLDPVTNAPYAYRVVDSLTIELGARFDSRDSVGLYGEQPEPWWRHDAGEHRFRFSLRADASVNPLPDSTR